MSSILFEIKNSIGFITLNKPDKLNSFNREMALLMQEKLDACKSNDIRCVFITGTGKAFSAGQDLAEVVDPNGPGMKKILSEHYNPIIKRIKKTGEAGYCSCKWCCQAERYTAVYNSKTINHFLPDGHFYFAVSFLYFQYFNAEPLRKQIVFHHVVDNRIGKPIFFVWHEIFFTHL